MRWVASAAGATPLGPADRATLGAAYRYVFKGRDALDVDGLPPTTPAELAGVLSDQALAEHAVRFLAVMALVDGRLDERKIVLVLRYATALRVHEDYLRQLAEVGLGHLQWVAMDMMRQNIRSIAGLVWNPDNVIGTFLPYSGTGSDVDLARRYQALGELPPGSFGRAFWAHYRRNVYAFPGEKNGLNEKYPARFHARAEWLRHLAARRAARLDLDRRDAQAGSDVRAHPARDLQLAPWHPAQ